MILGINPKHGALFAKEAQRLGWKPTMIAHNTMADPVVLDLAGPEALKGSTDRTDSLFRKRNEVRNAAHERHHVHDGVLNQMWPISWIGLFWFLLLATTALAQMESLGPNDSLAAAGLSTKEIREIIAAVKKSAYDMPKSWSAELRLRRIDLGNGPGIVVQGTSMLCGGTGNCQMWVFRKANENWVSLFANGQTVLAEGFHFGPAVTRHIKDLTIETNLSAEESKRVTYKFNGRRYRTK